ncbi:MAG: thioredoxin domain-containing protein [Paracoccaceae bacterium]
MTEMLKLTCAACGQMNRFPAARLAETPLCAICGEKLVAGKVAELDLAVHDKSVKGDDLPMLIDYWAPWCGPCRMMAPEFAKAALALAGKVRFAKINTEDFPVVSQRMGIRGIPLLILWHKGREVARLPGARPAAEIERFALANIGAQA